MKRIHSAVLTAVFLTLLAPFAASHPARAESPSYDMQGTQTDLWDNDVDYFSPPILLHRSKATFGLHYLNFTTLRYVRECMYWQQVCTGYNSHGQCVSWQNQCAQWGYHEYPVERRIELDFHSLPALVGDQEEVYEIQISRQRPAGEGEDWVQTWLQGVKTQAPVKIMNLDPYHYDISPK